MCVISSFFAFVSIVQTSKNRRKLLIQQKDETEDNDLHVIKK